MPVLHLYWVFDAYAVPANLKYAFWMCNALIFVSIFNIFSQIYKADLLHILLFDIFIILGKICHAHASAYL